VIEAFEPSTADQPLDVSVFAKSSAPQPYDRGYPWHEWAGYNAGPNAPQAVTA
jgi:hypothetical protein